MLGGPPGDLLTGVSLQCGDPSVNLELTDSARLASTELKGRAAPPSLPLPSAGGIDTQRWASVYMASWRPKLKSSASQGWHFIT